MAELPPLPGRRMHYDRDGTAVWHRRVDTNGLSVVDSLPLLNDEGAQGYTPPASGWITFIFPELRDVYGAYTVTYDANGCSSGFITSTDTTNGLDGTWTTQVATVSENWPFVRPGYREEISTFTAIGVRAVGAWVGGYANGGPLVRCVHLYGWMQAGESPHRLDIWHPTLDQAVDGNHLNFGSQVRGTVQTKSFRVKNLSPTQTASGLTAQVHIPIDLTPSLTTQLQVSIDGGSTWAASLIVPDLAPGAISGQIQVRYAPSLTAFLVTLSPRILVNASGWA